jgi:DNA-binding beta-propeller fold protein YncE
MNFAAFSRYGSAICMIGVLAGCGSSYGARSTGQLSPPLASADLAQPNNVLAPLVYVADHKNNLVDVFDLRGALKYTITSGLNAPEGLFVDTRHNLWVANPGANNVLVFHRGDMIPSETLHDSNQPNDVALCSNGTAFVADLSGKGGIGVYPSGQMRPMRRLRAQITERGSLEFYVTCDSAGNVFGTGFIGVSPFIATIGFKHGRESGYYLLNSHAWSDAGIKATKSGTLLIAFGGGTTGYVKEFAESGKPTGREISTSPDIWSDLALNAKQGVVFGTDPMHNVVVGLTFPGDKVARTYSNSNLVQPEGVAVDPGD